VIQLISIAGALLVLLAFALQQWGRWNAAELRYLWANAIGAGILAVIAAIEHQWGFLLMEGVWTVVSFAGLIRRKPLAH
jgi:hypothetical protein